MNHHQKLSPFRKIFKSTLVFYKTNWKKMVYLFLPIEAVVLISLICLDLIPDSDSVIAAIAVGLFSLATFIFSCFYKFLVLDAPGIVERINEGERPHPKAWYKSVLRKIIPLAVVMFCVGILNFIFILLTMIPAGIVFLVTSILTKGLLQDSISSMLFTIALSVILLYFALRFIIKFFVGGIFSAYMYIFEGRKGLDAVASSFLLTSKRQFRLSWRMAIIWILSAVPFVLVAIAIGLFIPINNLSDIYSAFFLHEEPALLNPGIFASVVLDVFTSLATLLSATFFVTFTYFLWKDVKTTSHAFNESEYSKTRKHLRSLIIVGIIVIAALIVFSLIYDTVSY
ncbi:MAG: hypothetical protein JWP09_850 [Candidatus Taylorbacteria bacterium]|nr:hypothetical protein [Candidatus Taylorbacteria bacterium]